MSILVLVVMLCKTAITSDILMTIKKVENIFILVLQLLRIVELVIKEAIENELALFTLEVVLLTLTLVVTRAGREQLKHGMSKRLELCSSH